MHEVFQVTDLLELIMDFLPREDTYAFGLTCHLVWILAVRRIWSSADMLNVLGVPEVLQRVGQEMGNDPEPLSPSGVLAAAKRSLYLYAEYVRTLTISRIETGQELLVILAAVNSSGKGLEQVFCKLRKLHLVVLDTTYDLDVSLLLNLELAQITMEITHSIAPDSLYERCANLLRTHRRRIQCFPSLELDITPPWESLPSSLIDQLAETFKGYTSCRTLVITVMGLATTHFRLLAEMENLENLALWRCRCEGLTAGFLPATAFPKLACLYFSGISRDNVGELLPDSEGLLPFLSAISSNQISKLELSAVPTALVMNAVGIIAAKWGNSLTSIRLTVGYRALSDRGSAEITMQDVRCLMHCKLLRRVAILSELLIDFSDDDIAELAAAWPALQSLNIQDRCFSLVSVHTRRTSRSLEALCQACPLIQEVWVSVDFDVISTSSVTIQSYSLRRLHVGHSTCKDAIVVSDLLRRLFPRLEIFEYSIHRAWRSDGEPDCLPCDKMEDVAKRLGVITEK